MLATSQMRSAVLLNTGFEEWVALGSEPPFNWEPRDWTSNNAAMEFSTVPIVKSTDAHSGSYAAQISTRSPFDAPIPGVLVNGSAAVDMAGYTVNIITGGSPTKTLTIKDEVEVKGVKGYYKFQSTDANDFGKAVVILKKYNAETNKRDTIGIGTVDLLPASEYTLFIVPIGILKPESEDSVVIAFYSTNPDSPKDGGVLFVDDIEYTTVDAVHDIDSESIQQIYPNPTKDGKVKINLPDNEYRNNQIIFYNMAGSVVTTVRLVTNNQEIEIDLPSGEYFYKIVNSDGKVFYNNKIIINK